MNTALPPHATQIRTLYDNLKAKHPQSSSRDTAHALGVSEMELLASGIDHISALPLAVSPQELFKQLGLLGDIMILTRNDWCIHKCYDRYCDVWAGTNMGISQGTKVNLRMSFDHWGDVWAINDNGRHSIQFFDTSGTAIHKAFCTPATDMNAYHNLVAQFIESSPSWPKTKPIIKPNGHINVAPSGLRAQWLRMTDINECNALLQGLDLTYLAALRCLGSDVAQQIENIHIRHILKNALRHKIPIMCSVGNNGITQVSSGQLYALGEKESWITILTAHSSLSVDLAAIMQTWIVCRSSKDNWLLSLECFSAMGEPIVQFFGPDRTNSVAQLVWNKLMTDLCSYPLISASA